MSVPQDPQFEVSIDSVLASFNRRIAAIMLECAMAEARMQQLAEQLATVEAENAQLAEMVNHLQSQVSTPTDPPQKFKVIPPE